MSLPKFMILYCSDGTYTLIENDRKTVYEFSYKRKNLSFEEVQDIQHKLLNNPDTEVNDTAQSAASF